MIFYLYGIDKSFLFIWNLLLCLNFQEHLPILDRMLKMVFQNLINYWMIMTKSQMTKNWMTKNWITMSQAPVGLY